MKKLFLLLVFSLTILVSSENAMAIVDVDDDGMSDVWERLYGFPLVDDGTDPAIEKPAGDFDGDGVSNVMESVAGTNPKSSSSPFKITSFIPAALTGTHQIQFSQVIGKKYQLQSSPDLQTWLDTGDAFLGTTTPVTLMTSVNAAKMFYRVSVKDADSDFDSLSNWEESIICSNPNLIDTDADGVDDNIEYRYGSDPCSAADGGTPQPFTPAQLPPPKPLKFRLFTGVLLGTSYT
jgi:hypothetical protein